MATKAYLMVNVAEKFCHSGYLDVLRDLANIPEVRFIERIDGICDLLVQVEAIGTTALVTDQIMPKQWVKSLRVLAVQPAEPDETTGVAMPEFRKAETAILSKQ